MGGFLLAHNYSQIRVTNFSILTRNLSKSMCEYRVEFTTGRPVSRSSNSDQVGPPKGIDNLKSGFWFW